MDIFALIFFGPMFVLPAILVVPLLQWRKLLPGGVPTPLYICLFSGLAFGSFLIKERVEPIFIEPARFQQEHLGRIYGTASNLEGFEESGFQDSRVEWTYALSPDQARALRKHCQWSEIPSLFPPRCYLYRWNDDQRFHFIELRGKRLVLAKWD